MPNWCTNEVVIAGSVLDIAKLKALIGDDFDFNKIVPMPEQLRTSDGMIGMTAGGTAVVKNENTKVFHMAGHCRAKDVSIFARVDMIKTSNAALAIIEGYRPCKVCMVNPNMRGQGFDKPLEEAAALYKEFGADNVLDWARKNWGTKWDVSDVQSDYSPMPNSNSLGEVATFTFQTAWSPPEPIYHALCDLFSDLDIKWHWGEPGCGQSGDLDTGEVYDYRCGCDDMDCLDCFPEDEDENEV